MKEKRIFEISGRSKKYTMHLISANIISFIPIIVLFVIGTEDEGPSIFYILLLIIFVLLAIGLLYHTYLYSRIKKVIIDGDHLYFFNQDELKNKIALQDIRRVTYEIRPGYRYLYPFWSNLYFLIYYQEEGDMKTLFIGFHFFNDDDVIRIYYALRRRLKVQNVRRYIFP